MIRKKKVDEDVLVDAGQSRVKTVPYLWEKYDKKIVPYLMKKLSCKSVYSVPRLKCISINIGFGHHSRDDKNLEQAVQELSLIAGQKPVIVKARKSIAGFSIRERQPVGAFVTLRGRKSFEFLLRLVLVVLPRIKDFRGCKSSSFDGFGNYAFGISDLSTFPEISQDKVIKQRGVNIVIGTTAANREDAKVLLACFGMPFRNYLEESRMLWQKKA